MGLRSAAHPTIDGTETKVAVGQERAHTEFLGQVEGLLVGGLSLFKRRGIVRCSDVAQELLGIDLIDSILPVAVRQRPAWSMKKCARPSVAQAAAASSQPCPFATPLSPQHAQTVRLILSEVWVF